MKQLVMAVVLAALATTVHAQVTCQTYGNTTSCNGTLGGQTLSVPQLNLGAIANLPENVASMQLAQAQAQLARAQAQQLREQTELLREQIQALRQQQQQQQQQQQSDRPKPAFAPAPEPQSKEWMLEKEACAQASAACMFAGRVHSIRRVFLSACGLDPTAHPASVCEPLGTLDARAHSLLEQVTHAAVARMHDRTGE
jgi:TolA-binding protein